MPPQASANLTKSIGSSETPYSGLPRNTICSHLIIPSVLFLMMTTLIGRRYLTAVANSPISIVKPPSPTNATDCRPGYAICAAIAYGSPGAIVARLPEQEKSWLRLMLMWRATHVVMVPRSEERRVGKECRIEE